MKKITLIIILLFASISTFAVIGFLLIRTTGGYSFLFKPYFGNSKTEVVYSKSISNKFTLDEISNHNLPTDCYLVINNNVYDVSSYIVYHPGGSKVITSRCGQEVSGIFAKIHSNRAWDLLKRFKIGTVVSNINESQNVNNAHKSLDDIAISVKKNKPEVEIIKVIPKKDFYIAKVIYNGKLYEFHIDNKGNIFKEELEDDEFDWSLWDSDKDD